MNNEKLDNDIKNLKIKSLFSMYLINVKYHYIKGIGFLLENLKEFIIHLAYFVIILILLPFGFLINAITLIRYNIQKLKELETENKETRLKIEYSYYVVTDIENEKNKYYDKVYIYHRLRLIERKKELEDKQ